MLSPFSTRSMTSDAFFRNSVKLTVFMVRASKKKAIHIVRYCT